MHSQMVSSIVNDKAGTTTPGQSGLGSNGNKKVAKLRAICRTFVGGGGLNAVGIFYIPNPLGNFFFHHTTCESTCDTMSSSAANQG